MQDNLMNLIIYKMMDHIKDKYNKHFNNLQYNLINKFQDLKSNKESYLYLDSSNINNLFNFYKLSIINHIANNNYYFENNHSNIIFNRFTKFFLLYIF